MAGFDERTCQEAAEGLVVLCQKYACHNFPFNGGECNTRIVNMRVRQHHALALPGVLVIEFVIKGEFAPA
jgi:hypothetical protein